MTRTAFCVLLLALLSAQPAAPVADKIVPDKADIDTARKNRQLIEESLKGGRVCQLPAGLIHLDRSLILGPQHSGATLQGRGPATILRNSFSAANAENNTLTVAGTGIAYYQSADVVDGEYVLHPTIPGTGLPWDHWSNQTELLTPGNVVYLFAFDSYLSANPPPRKRAVVKSFDPATRRLVTEPRAVPGLTSLKWMAGRPIRDVKEEERVVNLTTAADAALYPAGRSVYVTSGPALANAALGEHRRVLAADPQTGVVTLDRAVTRGYEDATLACVNPVSNVTLSRLALAQPAHPAANPLFAQFCTGLTLDRVTATDPLSTSCSVVNCGTVTAKDCDWNALHLNINHDVVIDGGLLAQVYGEEGATTTTLRNLTIRANPRQPGNGVIWHVGSDRLKLERVRIDGFGTKIEGSGNSVAFMASGRGLNFTDVTVTMANGVGAGYVDSQGGMIRRLASNTGLTLTGGRNWWISDSSSSGWEIRSGTSGAASGTSNFPKAPGWTVQD